MNNTLSPAAGGAIQLPSRGALADHSHDDKTTFLTLASQPGTFLSFPRNLSQNCTAPWYPSNRSTWAICSGRSNAGVELV